MKYLLVKGMEGWGDRIFSVAEAIDYCKETGRILVLDFWKCSVYSNFYKDGVDKHTFNLYFEIEDFDYLSSLPSEHGETYIPKFWNRENVYKHFQQLKEYYEIYFEDALKEYNWSIKSSGYFDTKRCFVDLYDKNYNLIHYDEDVVLFKDSKLRMLPYDSYDDNKVIKNFNFKIKRNVLDIVDEFCEKHDIENIVGIHGRYSPSHSFQTGNLRFPAKGILETRKAYKGERVFLATDSQDVKDIIKQFADVVDYRKHVKLTDIMAWDEMPALYSVKNIDRELSGLEALVDALILSRCKKFVPLNNFSNFTKLVKVFRTKGL